MASIRVVVLMALIRVVILMALIRVVILMALIRVVILSASEGSPGRRRLFARGSFGLRPPA